MSAPQTPDESASEPTSPAPAKPGPSARARQLGTVVLEVLAGLRTPQEASTALGLSVQRYYTLEARAVEGLVGALEPRPRGGRRRERSPSRALEELQARYQELERELRRAHALVRITRRAIKVPASPTDKERKKARKQARSKGKRGPRKPTVRARKLAEKLQAPDGEAATDAAREAS
ncbi:MAG: hypothetical protein R3F62_03970 [Planctomycetota bacterium]